MRLKDYLRGLGMGMIVVVLILTIGGRNRTMTDEEIIARARQLGMVDGNQTLTDIQQKETASREESAREDTGDFYEGSIPSEPTDVEEMEESADTSVWSGSEEGTEAEESTEPSEETIQNGSEDAEESTLGQENLETGEADASKAPAEVTTITVTVQRGDSSVRVSRELAAAGVVKSAKDFDQYLCENGYDKRISVGSFEIPSGATYEEIAKIITKSK